jgi:hypothetical protein
MTTTPHGWYDDGQGATRWWDGSRWTDHTLPGAARHPGQRTQESLAQITAQAVVTPSAPKSQVWTIWVIAGLILTCATVGLILLTPPLMTALTSGSGTPGVAPTDPTGPESAEDSNRADDSLAPADEQAAIEAVEEHDWAWLDGNCNAYFETTTERFRRDVIQITDCDAFAAEVRQKAEAEPFMATVVKVEPIGSAIGVFRIESYVTRLDDTADETEEPVTYVHVLVSENGRWVIDDFFAE